VFALSCDSTGGEWRPFGKLRTGANLVKQFLGSCFHRFHPLGFDLLRCRRKISHRTHFPEKGLDGVTIQKASTNATLRVIYQDSVQSTKRVGKDGFRILISWHGETDI
jgi:hypothetical protein